MGAGGARTVRRVAPPSVLASARTTPRGGWDGPRLPVPVRRRAGAASLSQWVVRRASRAGAAPRRRGRDPQRAPRAAGGVGGRAMRRRPPQSRAPGARGRTCWAAGRGRLQRGARGRARVAHGPLDCATPWSSSKRPLRRGRLAQDPSTTSHYSWTTSSTGTVGSASPRRSCRSAAHPSEVRRSFPKFVLILRHPSEVWGVFS